MNKLNNRAINLGINKITNKKVSTGIELIDLVSNLEEPSDYLKGISLDTSYIMENVVIFSRTNKLDMYTRTPINHYRFNLIFNLKGTIDLDLDGDSLTIKENNSILLFPYQTHYYKASSENEVCCLYIGFDLESRESIECLRNKTNTICNLTIELLNRLLTSSKNSKIHIIMTLLSLFVDEIGNDHPYFIYTKDSIISQVQKYVYSDLTKIITVKSISDNLGISISTLQKHFKSNIGISLGRYIRNVKIDYACSILGKSHMTIKEASFLCGYESIYSFSRCFKRVTSMTPTEYKKTFPNI